MDSFDRDSMLDIFTFEMSQLVEQLEQVVLRSESGFTMDDINEIFRIMHTIKGSAAMMKFDSMATTAHSVEDMFYYLREENPQGIDSSKIADYVLDAMDFVKSELAKIEEGSHPDGDGSGIAKSIKDYLQVMKGGSDNAKPPSGSTQTNATANSKTESAAAVKQGSSLSNESDGTTSSVHSYQASIYFEAGCEMENVRAYTLIHNMGDDISNVTHIPEDILNEDSIAAIRNNGFNMSFISMLPYDSIKSKLMETIYLKELILNEQKPDDSAMNHYEAVVWFKQGAEMENVRAIALLKNIESSVSVISYTPEDLEDATKIDYIQKHGFSMVFDSALSYDSIHSLISKTIYLKEFDLKYKEEKTEMQSADRVKMETTAEAAADTGDASKNTQAAANTAQSKKAPVQHMISVSVGKLDTLLNLMGELVIAEAMVTQNPELENLVLESFIKETRQLRKIIDTVQETVMSMRMVPLSPTFFNMQRIVRDMCKQLNKDVNLEIVGEDTEVDKNIIEHIKDPIMHIIRNSIDHGIEMPDVRRQKGKNPKGNVLLEAKNSGGDVLIIIKDDGAGLNKTKIMEKAKRNGLLKKPESEYSDKEINQFIFLPGFSTNEKVTNFSGRGVGMDVAIKNLELVHGSVLVDSMLGEGSTFTLKIPLSLAIISGMTIRIGSAKYTIPIISIKQSFEVKEQDMIVDPDGNEMIKVRGEVYNLVRMNDFFALSEGVSNIEEGIIIMIENGDQFVCLLCDELIAEQQVVVKPIPAFIKKVKGISGCTLLGNGDISLIIDVSSFFDK